MLETRRAGKSKIGKNSKPISSAGPRRGGQTESTSSQKPSTRTARAAVITHFGMRMIFKGPGGKAKLIQRKTGVPTIAAKDGMHLNVGEEIRVQRSTRKQRDLENFTQQ